MEGYGEKIEYDNKHEVAKFFTHARVKRMEGSVVTDDLMGEFIAYDGKSESYRAQQYVARRLETGSRTGQGRYPTS